MKAICLLIIVSFTAMAAVSPPLVTHTDESSFDISGLYSAVKTIARKHYPHATSHELDNRIHIEHDTRIFIIHAARKTGEWQDPHESRGPNKDGILVNIEVRKGRWGGAAMVPQSFDDHYFTTHLMAPYSEKLDAHLYVHISYPKNVSKGFVVQMAELLNKFDQHVELKDAG